MIKFNSQIKILGAMPKASSRRIVILSNVQELVSVKFSNEN